MNGQLHHLIRVIDLSNKALKGINIDEYKDEKYISSVLFKTIVNDSFIYKMLKRNEVKIVAKSPVAWCKYLKSRNCERVYAKLNISEGNRNLSAFANGTSGEFMICIYNGYYEVWRNEFKYNEKSWDVQYNMIQKISGKFIVDNCDYKQSIDDLIEC